MTIPYSCRLNAMYQQVACLFGQPFNVYRPPYGTTLNQGPSFVGTIPLKVRPGGSNFAIPNIAGVNYFTVTGDRAFFQPGDVLQPVNASSEFPTMTVLNYDDGMPAVAFRTSRICTVTLSVNNPVYTNVYFDFISQSTATGPNGLIEDLSGALNIAHKKAVMYSRTSILPQFNSYDIQGMRVIETDGTVLVPWLVQSITNIGSLIVFNFGQEVG